MIKADTINYENIRENTENIRATNQNIRATNKNSKKKLYLLSIDVDTK